MRNFVTSGPVLLNTYKSCSLPIVDLVAAVGLKGYREEDILAATTSLDTTAWAWRRQGFHGCAGLKKQICYCDVVAGPPWMCDAVSQLQREEEGVVVSLRFRVSITAAFFTISWPPRSRIKGDDRVGCYGAMGWGCRELVFVVLWGWGWRKGKRREEDEMSLTMVKDATIDAGAICRWVGRGGCRQWWRERRQWWGGEVAQELQL